MPLSKLNTQFLLSEAKPSLDLSNKRMQQHYIDRLRQSSSLEELNSVIKEIQHVYNEEDLTLSVFQYHYENKLDTVDNQRLPLPDKIR